MRAEEIDPVAVLEALGVGDPETARATPVAGGWDTVLWRVELAGTVYALRLFRMEQRRVAQREIAAHRLVAEAGVPVPKVHAHGTWRDRPALLLSWCPGRPLGEVLRQRPSRAWALGHAFGAMQARIHAVRVPAALRSEAGDWIDWAGPDEALRAHLRSLPRRDDALLHLDYHPLNVLADERRVTAVIDWANVRVGDPRADLARTLTILRVQPTPPGSPPSMTLLRWLLAFAWRRGYAREAGPIDDSAPFLAWAGAAMVRDLAPRVGQPGKWVEPHHLDVIRRWTERQRRQAGISPD